MSSDDISFRDNNDSYSSSMNGSTNREPTEVNTHDRGYFSRCYWSGKVFWTYMLSDAVFRTSPAWWTGIELESELNESLINFPFVDCIEKVDSLKAIDIPHNTSRHANSDHWIFMAKVGAMLDREPELKTRLANIIQTRGGRINVDLDPAGAFPPSPPGSIDIGMDGGNKIAMYTSKLYEWCAQRSRSIDFIDKQLSIDPPLWQVQVLVEGLTFTGRAKKKVKARHIASKQACDELKIPV